MWERFKANGRDWPYSQYVNWVNMNIRMGRHNRMILPSCVVRAIRQKWPEPTGQYVGFMFADDQDGAFLL